MRVLLRLTLFCLRTSSCCEAFYVSDNCRQVRPGCLNTENVVWHGTHGYFLERLV